MPWQVALFYKNQHECGGSIISYKWILTAAHCLQGFEPLKYIVLVGATDKYKDGIEHKVQGSSIHRQYGKLDYDFGLLLLQKPIQFNSKVQAVALPKINDADLATGTICLISGYGNTENSSESTNLLRAVEVPVIDQEVCNEAYTGRVTPRMFCAGLFDEGGKNGKEILRQIA